MGSIKLPHASGNSMSIAAPATNPASDLELKLPATIGTAGQVLKNSSTPGTLEFASAGAILQVQENADKTSTTSISLSSNDTWYDITYLNVSITPASTNSKILLSFMAFGEGNTQDHLYRWRIERAISGGATTNIATTGTGNRAACMGMVPISYWSDNNDSTPTIFGCSNYLDSPSTTSAITYTIQLNCQTDSKNWAINRSYTDTNSNGYERGMSYITAMEVAG